MAQLKQRQLDSLIRAGKAGSHSDGGGLILRLNGKGAANWLHRYQMNGKRRDMGLGGYPDVTLVQAREKAREAKELISKHLRAEGVTQWIQPITLFEKDFKEKMNSLQSDEAIASSMEHAIKHAINVKMKENPVHYTSLLEKLIKILEERKMTWEERRRVLEEFVSREFSQGEETLAKDLGLESKRQLAIYETIQNRIDKNAVRDDVAYYNGTSKEEMVKNITLAVEENILKNRVKDFVHNPTRLQEMETGIFDMLLSEYYDDFGDYDKITQVTQAILELAKIHYADME